ncbi:hypothetical protein [Cryobacterium sp. Y29]|uniref:hypothetical protein n=1 Tax=Cryobacterium sp. Y29 TaxID=2048285 RepID=UPI002101B81E|nr:hypothetical protein [Cryobacterium sp. Y29]
MTIETWERSILSQQEAVFGRTNGSGHRSPAAPSSPNPTSPRPAVQTSHSSALLHPCDWRIQPRTTA